LCITGAVEARHAVPLRETSIDIMHNESMKMVLHIQRLLGKWFAPTDVFPVRFQRAKLIYFFISSLSLASSGSSFASVEVSVPPT
jgi:hypothetical protein